MSTGFATVAQRFDTGSAWLISNNPRAPYWEDPADRAYIANRHYRLAEIVRASAAAPGFFKPQWLQMVPGARPGLFVDGGLTPHNNPSLLLLMMTQARAFRLQWPVGPERLSLVSIGAGLFRGGLAPGQRPPSTARGLAVHSLIEAAGDSQLQTLAMLQWFSDPILSWTINSEIGDLSGEVLGGRRCSVSNAMTCHWMQIGYRPQMGVPITLLALARLRHMDDPGYMAELHAMATTAAERQVSAEHLVGVTPRT